MRVIVVGVGQSAGQGVGADHLYPIKSGKHVSMWGSPHTAGGLYT